jgi:glycosyltransferase involved in cell wall biosynthesis
MTRNAIVLVAYQCGPGLGSVSQIGWEWYAQLPQQQALPMQVTLVTHIRNRAVLEQAGAPLPHSDVIYIDTEWFAGPLYRLAKKLFPMSEHSVFMIASLDYFLFDFVAWRQLRRRQAAGRHWDLVHRATPVTLAAPTWLARLGLPLVVGPVNCGLQNPVGFDRILRSDSIWLVKLRLVGRLFDGLIGSTRQAACILTATRASLASVAQRYRPRCHMMLENGVHLDRFVAHDWPAAPGPGRPLRLLFVGRLVPPKALELLLQALLEVRAAGWEVELDVVGAGPMESTWRALTEQLHLTGVVYFHGALPAAQVAAQLALCHALCLPSVRESGGAVLLEAMASARPVIALAYGGPAEIVNAEVGALLAFVSPQQVIDDLASTLIDIIRQPEIWRERGLAGRRSAEKLYSWPAKVATAAAIYRKLLPQIAGLAGAASGPDRDAA